MVYVYVCADVCVSVYMWGCACLYVHVCGGQVLALSAFLGTSPPWFFEIGSFIIPGSRGFG